VHVGGDRPPLPVRGLDVALHQRRPLGLLAAHPAGQRRRDRHLDQLQDDQGPDRHRDDLAAQPRRLAGDAVVGEVRLEGQLLAGPGRGV
jgi:hypothetical protein